MTHRAQTESQEQNHKPTDLAMEVIDAYELAHDTISDLSSFLELIENLTLARECDERLLRTLIHAGVLHASDALKLIDEKIDDATKTLDALREHQS